MSRFRPIVVAACLAVLLTGALPGAAFAQRSSKFDQAFTESGPVGETLLGAARAWGRIALGWLQAILAAEHGYIVEAPVVPPKP